MVKKRPSKVDDKNTTLSSRQEAFCRYYAESGNGLQSAIKAGYSEKTAGQQASRLLNNVTIQEKIRSIRQETFKKNQATSEEVMNYLTKVMRGEIKDQFGLEASLSERTKAAQELAKRTVDIDNRLNGKADNVVTLNLNWDRDK